MDYLEVWAPKLLSLNLQACYGLDHVRLQPKEGTPVCVNLQHAIANIDRSSHWHLQQHLRVGHEGLRLDEEDEDEDVADMGDYAAPNMVGGGGDGNMIGNLMGDLPNHPPNAMLMQMLAILQQAGMQGAGMPGYNIPEQE